MVEAGGTGKDLVDIGNLVWHSVANLHNFHACSVVQKVNVDL